VAVAHMAGIQVTLALGRRSTCPHVDVWTGGPAPTDGLGIALVILFQELAE